MEPGRADPGPRGKNLGLGSGLRRAGSSNVGRAVSPPDVRFNTREGRVQMQRGSVLLEQLVAMVILAIAAASVFSLLSLGYLAAAMAQDVTVATNLAQRKLEETKAADYAVAVSLRRQAADAPAFSGFEWAIDVLEQQPGLKEVLATVYWKARGRERSVRLVTVVTRP